MKRLNNLYDKIISVENLILAESKARKGKRNSYGVKLFDKNSDEKIIELNKKLSNEEYKTSKYHIFNITTREGKDRTIYRLPYYPDRIVHHAIMNVMETIWHETFIQNTYSCVKNRGIHGAAKAIKKALKTDFENTQFCLKLDIRKFYPNIDHQILKNIIAKKIKDKKLLNLLYEIIDSATGVPIGNYLSQYFANLYLTYFDHFLKEEKKVKYYFRYADDIVILSSSKTQLHKLFNEIKTYLDQNLKLEIKSNYQIFPVQARGIDFVGYVFRHTHTRLRKTIKQRFAKAIARTKNKTKTPQNFPSYYGWCKHCNSINLLKKLTA